MNRFSFNFARLRRSGLPEACRAVAILGFAAVMLAAPRGWGWTADATTAKPDSGSPAAASAPRAAETEESLAITAEAPLAYQLPKELEGVGIVERRDQKIPTDVAFVDENGQPVVIGDYFKTGKPVLLTINFIDCPMLCGLELRGMVAGLNDAELDLGADFQIVTVSMNPKDEPELARRARDQYLSDYRRKTVGQGWHYLTGKKEEIDALCKAVGFGYRFDPSSGTYAHTPTIIFLTPDGRVSRYMSNVQFEPRDLQLALVEAGNGAIGTAMDKFLLMMCYHYDPLRNSYAASAMKIMRFGGAMTALAVGLGLALLWLTSLGRRRVQALPPVEQQAVGSSGESLSAPPGG